MSKIIFTTILTCCFIYLCSANGNDYQWGTVAATDTLLAKEIVTKPGFIGMIATQDYVYQQVGVAAPLTITAIKISDKKKFKGATAVISSGGVGSTEVNIKFTSPRGGGIKSTVEVYGTV